MDILPAWDYRRRLRLRLLRRIQNRAGDGNQGSAHQGQSRPAARYHRLHAPPEMAFSDPMAVACERHSQTGYLAVAAMAGLYGAIPRGRLVHNFRPDQDHPQPDLVALGGDRKLGIPRRICDRP